ncbi:phage protein Gp37 [Candidatus Vondammii sp. HM_W22]|uniref:phage protein Gp37 n=1 Tax=Candidatus Vondammii sp. HM_W22 TaxID=2687299 RepID=UPI001F13DF8C|nr:phage protein Gp37 [Candidatus Vondammii sp. HM_W22]
MTDPIATTEDAIITAAKATLGQTVRRLESVPGGWTLDTLKRALQFAPGVYVTFQGAVNGISQGYLSGRFTVYCVTKGADEQARRRGNERVIGAYDLVARLAPELNDLRVPEIGILQLRGIDNLFRDAMFDLGGTVYAIQFELPNIPLDYLADESAMDDFVTFDAVYDLNPPTGSGEPEANDHMIGLDQ